MSAINFIDNTINSGLQLCYETFMETNTEFVIKNITEYLNKIKWAGKDTWTGEYLETYLENFRGNANTMIVGNLMALSFAKQCGRTITVFNSQKLFNFGKNQWNRLRTRL